MNKLLILFLFASLTSCVPKSEYDELKTDNEQLRDELAELKPELDELRREQNEREERERQISAHSEADALKLIKDYYEFYNANMIYRKPKVRRDISAANKFIVSLEECVKKGGFSEDNFFWHSKVLTLTINIDGTYRVE